MDKFQHTIGRLAPKQINVAFFLKCHEKHEKTHATVLSGRSLAKIKEAKKIPRNGANRQISTRHELRTKWDAAGKEKGALSIHTQDHHSIAPTDRVISLHARGAARVESRQQFRAGQSRQPARPLPYIQQWNRPTAAGGLPLFSPLFSRHFFHAGNKQTPPRLIDRLTDWLIKTLSTD